MSTIARGIHDHEFLKLGLIHHTKSKDELLQVRWKVDPASVAPTEVDHSNITPGLDNNDDEGDCGPTSCDNIARTVSKYETGTQIDAEQAEVDQLYSLASNPPFNPVTRANDNGVENPDLYSAWMKYPMGKQEAPIAFGQLADLSDASIALAIDVFGGATLAVDLETAQQAQSSGAGPLVWDYKKSAEWGGHDVCTMKISKSTGLLYAWSWALFVGMTEAFRQRQGLEIFVPVFKSVAASNKFDQAVNSDAMISDFKNLTGSDLILPTIAPPTSTTISLSVTGSAAAHVSSAASKAKENLDQWAQAHFNKYFKLKEGS